MALILPSLCLLYHYTWKCAITKENSTLIGLSRGLQEGEAESPEQGGENGSCHGDVSSGYPPG